MRAPLLHFCLINWITVHIPIAVPFLDRDAIVISASLSIAQAAPVCRLDFSVRHQIRDGKATMRCLSGALPITVNDSLVAFQKLERKHI